MKRFLAFALLIAFTGTAQATDGDLDLTFGTAGRVITNFINRDEATALAIQPDGKIVAAGFGGWYAPNNADFALARYNTDGSLDMTFGISGRVLTDVSGVHDSITALVIQPDGKILVAGVAGLIYFDDFALARYNGDGSLDMSFGNAGRVTTHLSDFSDVVSALAIQPDGKIIAAGSAGSDFDTADSGDFALARYNTDGSLDMTFGRSGIVTTRLADRSSSISDLAVLSDGRIVTVGSVETNSALVRFNRDGSLDQSFGISGVVTTDFSGRSHALAIESDGKLIVSGRAAGNFAIARYNSDGSLDTTFGILGKVTSDFFGTVQGAAIQSDGGILIASTGNHSGSNIGIIARYSRFGLLDTTFGAGGMVELPSFFLTDMVIQIDGKIVTAGETSSSDAGDFALFRINNHDVPTEPRIQFNSGTVAVGNSYTATFSGSTLTDQTYFDLRFRSPNSNTEQVALNWQRGTSVSHTITGGTATGTWTVTGVRPHRDASDHASEFVFVSATLTVN
jgi:uncharacterized delta-60 repeat protein